MLHKYIFLKVLAIAFLFYQSAYSQSVDPNTFKLYTRYSFYSTEKKGEMLVHVPASFRHREIKVFLQRQSDTLGVWEGTPGEKIIRIPFNLYPKPASYQITASISIPSVSAKKYNASTKLVILRYKSNEVKTDRLTGGLIVNKLPFFPFGFYNYSPVHPSLPEEEIVRGFNVMSPYQRITPETFEDRKAYMDRCAQLGMKVHYNLLSVSGGGGVGSGIEGLSDTEKRERLLKEIDTFKDHPALLAWYIADEPNGYKIRPSVLEEIYRTVNERDPWHPVSIVFMAPFLASRDYEDALDIVMADPYPLPDLPVTMVGNVALQLKEEFTGKRPVWIVPQAFGGGELWKREPTLQEIRAMTWQSIINGATGIQYFVRQGPNYFPKSVAAWAECGRMAMEVAELTPWLLSDEKAPEVETSSKNIIVSSKLYNGKLLVMAVNKANEPLPAVIKISGVSNKRARSLFENRFVNVSGGGVLSDFLPPYGFHSYLIDLRSPVTPPSGNMMTDPGFEDLSSPGIPSACYARPGGDRGATYFLDSRVYHEGAHSLRLQTPVYDRGISIRFFPIRVRAGSTYRISVWAKADPEQRFKPSVHKDKLQPIVKEPQYIELKMEDFCLFWFVPGSEWREYVTFVTIPKDRSGQFKTNLILRMPGQGVAWIDNVRVSLE